MPRVNRLLLIAVLYVVIVFRSSSALAGAYGIAVTGTMVITTIMAFFVLWKCWKWQLPFAALTIAPFLMIDLVFLLANMLKIVEGGWMPLAIGASLMVLMLSWRRGTRIVAEKVRRHETRLTDVIEMLAKRPPEVVSGTAVFLTGNPDSTPRALLHNLKHNKVLHQNNIVLSVLTEDIPRVDDKKRASIERISSAFSRVILRFGFMETPNVPRALAALRPEGLKFDVMRTSFFLSRQALKPAVKSKMPKWQDHLFIRLARSADDASKYFHIPEDRAVEIGAQIAV